MKRLLAGIAFIVGAAFSVPSIAQPVDYVRVCDAFGAGYYYIPGTEFCLNPQTGLTRWDTEYGLMQAYSRVAQGAAVALAIPTPVIGPNQQFAIAGNYGRVGGVNALGFAFGARISPSLTIHAGVGLGLPGMAAGFIGLVQTPDPLFAVGTVMGFNYAW